MLYLKTKYLECLKMIDCGQRALPSLMCHTTMLNHLFDIANGLQYYHTLSTRYSESSQVQSINQFNLI